MGRMGAVSRRSAPHLISYFFDTESARSCTLEPFVAHILECRSFNLALFHPVAIMCNLPVQLDLRHGLHVRLWFDFQRVLISANNFVGRHVIVIAS